MSPEWANASGLQSLHAKRYSHLLHTLIWEKSNLQHFFVMVLLTISLIVLSRIFPYLILRSKTHGRTSPLSVITNLLCQQLLWKWLLSNCRFFIFKFAYFLTRKFIMSFNVGECLDCSPLYTFLITSNLYEDTLRLLTKSLISS